MSLTVKKARIMADLTQQDMAARLGVHRSTYIKLEENPGTLTIAQARIISAATGFSMEELFFAPGSTESRDAETGSESMS